jgi:hypothetical protein
LAAVVVVVVVLPVIVEAANWRGRRCEESSDRRGRDLDSNDARITTRREKIIVYL